MIDDNNNVYFPHQYETTKTCKDCGTVLTGGELTEYTGYCDVCEEN